MEARITVITLGVNDLERATAFYRDGLGWATPGIIGQEIPHGAVSFFKLHGGVLLALWPRTSLAHDSGLPVGVAQPTHMSLGHNVANEADVDGLLTLAVQAGATLIKSAGPTLYGGRAGYFQDPDGHLWEVAWNPGLALLGEVVPA